MIENLPAYISIIFILTTLLSVLLFYKAANNSKTVLLIVSVWIIIQGIVSYSKFYLAEKTFPPRFFLLIVPPLFTIIITFLTQKGRKFLDGMNLKILTYLQTVRVPVEIVLFLLYKSGQIPQLMTFEGRNYDILAGLTAPIIAYIGFSKKIITKKIIIIWNIICTGLLLNIVFNAALSAPFTFQQFAFDQPNVAVLYFPFVWLPCCIVPIVLLAHLASLKQLIIKNSN